MPDNQSQNTDRSHLADLYPQAKTLEERVYDKQIKAEQQASQRPKHVGVMTMLQLFGLSVGFVVAAFLSGYSLRLSIISGVSFSLLLMVMWLASVYWVYSHISRQFAALGYSSKPFLLAYTALYPSAIYGLSQMASPTSDTVAFSLGAVSVHVVLTAILMRLLGAR